MTEFLKLATLRQNGEGNIAEFFDSMCIKLFDYTRSEFN